MLGMIYYYSEYIHCVFCVELSYLCSLKNKDKVTDRLWFSLKINTTEPKRNASNVHVAGWANRKQYIWVHPPIRPWWDDNSTKFSTATSSSLLSRYLKPSQFMLLFKYYQSWCFFNVLMLMCMTVHDNATAHVKSWKHSKLISFC